MFAAVASIRSCRSSGGVEREGGGSCRGLSTGWKVASENWIISWLSLMNYNVRSGDWINSWGLLLQRRNICVMKWGWSPGGARDYWKSSMSKRTNWWWVRGGGGILFLLVLFLLLGQLILGHLQPRIISKLLKWALGVALFNLLVNGRMQGEVWGVTRRKSPAEDVSPVQHIIYPRIYIQKLGSCHPQF
jgi:hypothetical protein